MADVQTPTHEQATALTVGAFFDELLRAGVRDVVVSPGSRSTGLTMVADASDMNLYLDVDERGAAFFALGLAKATGRAVCVVCTSGTAVANYMPAVLEAETSRVPLIILTGDRPSRLQKLGAPQTCDQLHMFGTHVRGFWQMPETDGSQRAIRHARQVAREAVIASAPGTLDAAPVHVNFPFEEPLKPDLTVEGLFSTERNAQPELPSVVEPNFGRIGAREARAIAEAIASHKAIFLCGEGTFAPGATRDEKLEQAQRLGTLAKAFDAPLLADPLSNLRGLGDAVISSYDTFIERPDAPDFDLVVRFGRYPVSKPVFRMLETKPHVQIVVDPAATRDFNSATTTFVRTTPSSFAEAMIAMVQGRSIGASHAGQLYRWQVAQRQLSARMEERDGNMAADFEGTYVRSIVHALPSDALLFCGNSMAVRAVDTFFDPQEPTFTLLGNRGLNGIDGTLSSAIGAAQNFKQTVALVGDLTMLHDINALALQNEMLIRERDGHARPSITIVLMNNNGGAIFDMLPQKSEEPYFERLFLTPQNVNFRLAAEAFGVPYHKATTPEMFERALSTSLATPGIDLIEIPLPLEGVRARYNRFK